MQCTDLHHQQPLQQTAAACCEQPAHPAQLLPCCLPGLQSLPQLWLVQTSSLLQKARLLQPVSTEGLLAMLLLSSGCCKRSAKRFFHCMLQSLGITLSLPSTALQQTSGSCVEGSVWSTFTGHACFNNIFCTGTIWVFTRQCFCTGECSYRFGFKHVVHTAINMWYVQQGWAGKANVQLRDTGK